MERLKLGRCLVIDAGNTRLKWWVFENDAIVNSYAGSYESPYFPEKCSYAILASVGKDVDSLIRVFQPFAEHWMIASEAKKWPVLSKYTWDSLGVDRKALICGAYSLLKNENCLIVSFGTCVTYDVLSEGVHIGGNISPGLRMRLDAMHEKTHLLPQLTPESAPIFGTTTKEAMHSGAKNGLSFEVEGFFEQAQQTYGKLRLLITGGDAVEMLPLPKISAEHVENLTAIGLYHLLQTNAI